MEEAPLSPPSSEQGDAPDLASRQEEEEEGEEKGEEETGADWVPHYGIALALIIMFIVVVIYVASFYWDKTKKPLSFTSPSLDRH